MTATTALWKEPDLIAPRITAPSDDNPAHTSAARDHGLPGPIMTGPALLDHSLAALARRLDSPPVGVVRIRFLRPVPPQQQLMLRFTTPASPSADPDHSIPQPSWEIVADEGTAFVAGAAVLTAPVEAPQPVVRGRGARLLVGGGGVEDLATRSRDVRQRHHTYWLPEELVDPGFYVEDTILRVREAISFEGPTLQPGIELTLVRHVATGTALEFTAHVVGLGTWRRGLSVEYRAVFRTSTTHELVAAVSSAALEVRPEIPQADAHPVVPQSEGN
ncbi:hypothetical protein AB3X52_08720 [Nocardioides sp. DS6]|uniref:Thioesterase domain-containing protein n=1 Tax=Nocardioides eburneus TaxID=3231482 RepID=A0ABV3SXN7_9ACTN